MQQAKDDIPVRIDIIDAVARQQPGFGGASKLVMFSLQHEHTDRLESIARKTGN
jgi:hypothetical protein